MEPTELEKNLGELEEKIERVRALYEQYFVGIEKLEPQIPRKDVERILVVMRKEQIRNTAMRFKFQTLVQRFNTMQQHWGRTMREIENGTFRRDVLKAAARFGAEEALTMVGKRQAEKLKKVIEAQKERLGAKQPKGKGKSEIYEEVSSSDVEMVDDVDDDAPTPPPVHVIDPDDANAGFGSPQGFPGQATYPEQPQYAAQPGYGQAGYEPQYAGHPGYGQGHPGQGHPGQGHPGQGHPRQGGYAGPQGYAAPQAAYGSQSYDAQGYPMHGQGVVYPGAGSQQPAGYPPAQSQGYPGPQGAAQRTGAIDTGMQPQPGYRQPAPGFAPPIDPLSSYGDGIGAEGTDNRGTAYGQPAGGEAVKKKGGLRWGGAGGRRADPEALKRIASLAGPDAAQPAEVAEAPAPRRPLLSSPIDLGLPEEPTSVEPPQQRRPLLSSPIDVEVGSEPPPAPSRSAPNASRASAEPPNKAEEPHPTSGPTPLGERPRPQLRPPPPTDLAREKSGGKPAPRSQREFGDLNDGRLREIYGQYVQARRDRNESTAGITFEKLADSLRSQADKLKGKHASKRVDYEVVVKDGKTLIKPIVK